MDRKIYGSATMTLLTFTNTENVTADKELFIKKLSEEGVTNLNGRVSFAATGLGGIRYARIDIWSPPQQIEIIGSTPVTTTIASEKFAEWGIYVEVSYLDEISQSVAFTLTDFTSTTGSGTRLIDDLYGGSNSGAQRITKLYGSVNGETKLIHQGFGHLDYGYGQVFYYTDNGHTVLSSQMLYTEADVYSLSGSLHATRQTWDTTINGVTISNKDIYGVILTNKVTTLPSYFLSGCEALNYPLALPQTLTAISDSGESGGSAFLLWCSSMTSVVNIGNLSTSIVKGISSQCFAVNSSSVPAYTSGIKIAGANRAQWLADFPNSGAPAYRKLVDAGY